ncbi:hypothetical protein E2562_010201, partial [Oryza meyeriana var. granulata]
MASGGAAAPNKEEASCFEPCRSEEWMMERADKLKEDVCSLFWTCNDMVER